MKPDIRKLTSSEMEWVITQLPPAPSIFVNVFFGEGSRKGWRTLSFTIENYQKIENIKQYLLERHPSTVAFEVCRKEKENETND